MRLQILGLACPWGFCIAFAQALGRSFALALPRGSSGFANCKLGDRLLHSCEGLFYPGQPVPLPTSLPLNLRPRHPGPNQGWIRGVSRRSCPATSGEWASRGRCYPPSTFVRISSIFVSTFVGEFVGQISLFACSVSLSAKFKSIGFLSSQSTEHLLEGCRRHTHKGHRDNASEGVFRVFSGCCQGVFRAFFPMPFLGVPVGPNT